MRPDKQRTLELQRTLDAPRQRVFELWTDPQAIKQWFGGDSVTVEHVELDLRVGGSYLIRVKEEEGHTLVSGEFLFVEPPERLVYTWTMDGPLMSTEENVVRVAFKEQGQRTEIYLTHGPFADDEVRAAHEQGWEVCVQALAIQL